MLWIVCLAPILQAVTHIGSSQNSKFHRTPILQYIYEDSFSAQMYADLKPAINFTKSIVTIETTVFMVYCCVVRRQIT